jgi:sulfite exporter TauE/SafE/copper chaperone CopZ/plastocyanin
MKKKYNIKGMHCRSCEILLEKNISQIEGVKKVEVSYKKGIAEVEFAYGAPNDAAIAKAVNEAGYSLGQGGKLPWLTSDGDTWFDIMLGVSALIVLFMAGKLLGVFNGIGTAFGSAPTYPIVFVIGLTAGISTCMAIVGGLVAGFSASYAEAHQHATRWERFGPNLFFNAGRLASYTVLGGVIGALGSAVKLSTGFTGLLVAAAGMVMLYLGLKLTGISPKLSNLSLALPKKLGRAFGMKDQNRGYSHKEALIGGALTFFLPCGFTQAVQIYAVTTGSFASGAIIMFLFALGTLPGLLGVGALTSVLKGTPARIFFRFVGLVVLVLGIFNLANGYNLSGINFQFPSLASAGSSCPVGKPCPSGQGASGGQIAQIENGEQVVNMTQAASGYSPNNFTVKKGIPVKWVIDSQDAYTCSASIRMPAYNIAQFLQAGQNVIMFTPTQTGNVRFTCGMGMFSGTFTVVE